MKLLFHLLYYKSRIFFSSDFHLSPKQLLKSIASGIVYALFAYGFYKISYAIVSASLLQFKIGDYLFHRFVAVILFIFAMSVSAGNILVSLATLFRSKETAYLFTKPIPFRTLYFVRFLDNFFYSSGTLFLVMLSVLIAYQQHYQIPLFQFALMFLLLLFPFVLLAGLTGSVLLMFIIQAAKKIGYRLSLVLMAVSYLVFIIVYYQAANPLEMVTEVLKYYPKLDRYFTALDKPVFAYMPNFWVSEGMYALVSGRIAEFWKYAGFINGLLLLMLVAAVSTAHKLFYSSFLIVQEISLGEKEKKSRKQKGEDEPKEIEHWSGSMRPNVASLLNKELLLFMREPTQVVHLGIMIFLMVIFMVSVQGRPAEVFISNNFRIQTIIYLSLFLFNSFLISSLALRFVFPMFSLEGETFWKIRSSPINLRKYLFAKYLIVTLVLTATALMLNAFANPARRYSELFENSNLILSCVTVTIVTINFSLGIVFADFKEKNPIRISSSQGASTAFLIAMLMLGAMIGALFLPLMNYFYVVQTRGMELTYSSLNTVSAAIALFSLAVAALFFLIGYFALKRDF